MRGQGMKINYIGKIGVIVVGEHFMIIIDEKMYGKFHMKQLNQITKMFESEEN
jgi:hypothetical protein